MKYLLYLLAVLTLVPAVYIYSRGSRLQQSLEIGTQNPQNSAQTLRQTITPTPTPATNKLPAKHLITTAFVPQAPEKNWDQPWQDTCEEAALLTLYYYYQSTSNPSVDKIKADLLDIIDYQQEQGWGHDVDQEKIILLARDHFGVNLVKTQNPSVLDIKQLISRDIPVLATANGKTLYRENKHFNSGGPPYHALVILGYDDHTSKFIVHDVGTQFGAYFKYSQKLLLSAIRDLPQSGNKYDIESGETSILSLEQP